MSANPEWMVLDYGDKVCGFCLRWNLSSWIELHCIIETMWDQHGLMQNMVILNKNCLIIYNISDNSENFFLRPKLHLHIFQTVKIHLFSYFTLRKAHLRGWTQQICKTLTNCRSRWNRLEEMRKVVSLFCSKRQVELMWVTVVAKQNKDVSVCFIWYCIKCRTHSSPQCHADTRPLTRFSLPHLLL